MQIVYFPEQLHLRAPTVMGVLCDAATNSWMTLLDVADYIRAGETVAIRPASPTELQRAEGRVAIYEIGVQLGEQVAALLDEEPRDQAEQKLQVVHDAVSAIDVGLPDLVAQLSEPETRAPDAFEAASQEVVDDIPGVCDALQAAYAAGDAVAALDLASHITSRLIDTLVAARTSAA